MPGTVFHLRSFFKSSGWLRFAVDPNGRRRKRGMVGWRDLIDFPFSFASPERPRPRKEFSSSSLLVHVKLGGRRRRRRRAVFERLQPPPPFGLSLTVSASLPLPIRPPEITSINPLPQNSDMEDVGIRRRREQGQHLGKCGEERNSSAAGISALQFPRAFNTGSREFYLLFF